MALRHRIPKEGLVWHTDRGSQYASYEHRDLLKQYGIIQSMSWKEIAGIIQLLKVFSNH